MSGSIGALLTVFLLLVAMLAFVCYRDYKKRALLGEFYDRVSISAMQGVFFNDLGRTRHWTIIV